MAAAAAALLALLLGLCTLLLIGFETGPVAFLVGLVAATLPAPVYVLLVLWLDRFESEPLWMLATAFFWGALVAVFFALVVNTLGGVVVGLTFGAGAADLFGKSLSAPVVEEVSKALALFTLYFWRRDEFDGVLDGIVYAGMVGLGFAMTENVLYYSRAALEGNTVAVFVARGMFTPYAHPLFTSMTGIGLGLASQSGRRASRVALPVVGLGLAVVLHSVWNTSLYLSEKFDDGRLALAMYFLVMVPVFAGVLVAVVIALRREGRILREHLSGEAGRGLLTADEYETLCSVGGRVGASAGALVRGGLSAWRARMKFHGVASELAFHRRRVAMGLGAGDAEDAAREAMYVELLCELRGRMIQR
ncbi:MAG: PrsW family intramembrane metalloprotease [Pyrinomonadaceae bacterium]